MLVLLPSACSSPSSLILVEAPDNTSAPETTLLETAATSVPVPDAPPLAAELAFTATVPTDLVARLGDDRLYVAERAGRVVIVDPTGGDATVLVDFSDEVGQEHDQAFMSLTFDPAGSSLYLHFSGLDGASVLRRLVLDGDSVLSSEDLLRVDQPLPDHNGGSIRFGPDGYLYWALGDGGGGIDAIQTAQNTTNPLGSILRLDVSSGASYAVPSDNPLVGTPGARSEIWSWGWRNPWRISFDPASGDLWVADVGLDGAEEVNVVGADEGLGRGLNFGWPYREGTADDTTLGQIPADLADPILEYNHEPDRCSISGGEVYRGQAIPDLVGEYLFADFCSGELFGLNEAAGLRFSVHGPRFAQPVGFGVDNDGEIYVIEISGDIYRLIGA